MGGVEKECKKEAASHILFGHSVVGVEPTHSPINLLLEGLLVTLQQLGSFLVQRVVGIGFLERERKGKIFSKNLIYNINAITLRNSIHN